MCAVKVNEQIAEFLKENCNGRTNKELAELVNKQFCKNYKQASIKKYKLLLGLKSGLRVYHNAPIGTERLYHGYIQVKVKQPDVWKLKQTVVWENANGKVPAGYRLLFLDGNKKNVTLDNLTLVSQAELNTLNAMNYKAKSGELTKTALAVTFKR